MGFFDRIFKRKPKKPVQPEPEKIQPAPKKTVDAPPDKEKPLVPEVKKELKPAPPKPEQKISDAPPAAPKVKPKRKPTTEAYRLLLRPHVTEKSTQLQQSNQIVFEVPPFANKIEIKKAIEAIYGIRPTKVRVIRSPRKLVTFGRIHGQQSAKKKAVVCFQKDQKIDIFSEV